MWPITLPGFTSGTHRFQSTQRGMDPIQPITVPACHFFKKFVAGDSTQDAIYQIFRGVEKAQSRCLYNFR
jgi:hypothetical protein